MSTNLDSPEPTTDGQIDTTAAYHRLKADIEAAEGIDPVHPDLVPEVTVEDLIVEWAIMHFGGANVTRQDYLPESRRVADVMIQTPLVTFAIEIENDFPSVTTGVGQAQRYAAHNPKRFVPVVMVPSGLAQQPELSMDRQRCTIIEFDLPSDAREQFVA
jgi:hypothetical protein